MPQEQLKKIARIEAENLQKEKEEKLRLAEEKKLTDRYNAIVQQADLELGKTNYAKAKQLYMKALNIKSSEAYPKQKLNDIQNTQDGLAAEAKERKERIAAEAELKKKYDLAISKAKSYLLKEDLVNAQAAYNDAAALKPSEVEPKNQLKIITDKLAAIARQNEIDENYEKQIHIADSLMIAENYESAKDIYKEASGIKKTETYPYSQIRYCDSQIKIAQQEEEENKKQNAINKEIENKRNSTISLCRQINQ